MRSRTQRLLTRVSSASRPLRDILSALLAVLCLSAAVAQSKELTREIYTPPAGKGPAVVVVSGTSGTAAYREYSSKLAETGYYVVLIDGNDVLIRPNDARSQDGAANLRKIIMEAQSAEKAVSGKVALVGFSRGGGGVLRHGAPLKDHVAAVVAYYPSITEMGPNMEPLASQMQTPVLVLAGGQDTFRGCCLVESMRALAAAPKTVPFELIVYPEANHGFNLTFFPYYRAQDAADAWRRTTEFLKKYHPVSSH